jgi:hypothetical protein
MSKQLTPEDLAARSARAVAAATEAGRALGLEVTEPKVLHDVFSVVVHVAPAPVVVRVPMVLPDPLRDDEQALLARQRNELAVAGWLADEGHAVVPPSPLVPREPVWRDGFAMTMWEFVEEDALAEPDAFGEAGVARLHDVLRQYPGELPFLSSLAMVSPCLSQLESQPELIDAADLDRAKREWEFLAPKLSSASDFRAAFDGIDVQALHGDSPGYNIIRTHQGPLFSDFEDATVGPIEWDMAMAGPDAEDDYNNAAAAIGGRPLDGTVMKVVNATRLLQVVACLALVPQLPVLAQGLKPSLRMWRDSPEVTTLLS